MINKHETKIISFLFSLQNVYKSEEARSDIGQLELSEEELTDDFTAMLQALHIMYQEITQDNTDLIGFTHILNRLAMQYLMVPKKDVEVDEN